MEEKNDRQSIISSRSRTLRSANKVMGHRISRKVSNEIAFLIIVIIHISLICRLRAANVLLIGVRGLGSEIAKDILLSGINSLTMLDNGVVTEEEQMKNFLLPRDSVGKKVIF